MRVLWAALAAISAVIAVQSLYAATMTDHRNHLDGWINVAIFSIGPVAYLIVKAKRKPKN